MRVLTYAPGQNVINEGELSDAFYVVAKGEAEVLQRDAAGEQHVVNVIKEDEYFGEIGLLRGEPRNATVRARTSLEVIQVDKDAFELLVKSSQQTADEIARVAQSRMREAAPTR
jgi:CRP-like cAMP-binding protein